MNMRMPAAILALCWSGTGAAQAPADLRELSLEELGSIRVSSVSKRAEPLSEAPAAAFVITREDIRRAGVTSLPEALRLAPNLFVARVDASQYAVSARGFNSTTANKLQVLIDGRSVYTPLFSGVFWDVQDVLLEDVERIEVLSGPAGVLWGSNAVNGVINIITRSSRETQGAYVALGSGNAESGAAARYGTKLGADGTFRVYAKGVHRAQTERANGAGVRDSWSKPQGGFRADWGRAADGFTLQGDAYDGGIDDAVTADRTISGANLLGRWSRTLGEGSGLQVQAYYDSTRRIHPGSFAETLETWDLDVQHRFVARAGHEVVWGGGYRHMRDDVTNTAALAFLPAKKTLRLANLFAQDTIDLAPGWRLTLGAKLEDNAYTGLEFQPNARLAWKLPEAGLLWGAVSRAVRTPSRLDREFSVPGNAPFLFVTGTGFESEKLTAYELGWRAPPTARATFSVAAYYNDYDDLRSIEPVGGGTSILGNGMEGHTYGLEAWGSYRVNDAWRLHAGYNRLRKDLGFKPGSGDTNVSAAGNDPGYQLLLRSSSSLAPNLELDVLVRHVAELPSPRVPDYTALDVRLGWTVQRGLVLSLTGTSLNDAKHPEFGTAATRSEIERALYLELAWRTP